MCGIFLQNLDDLVRRLNGRLLLEIDQFVLPAVIEYFSFLESGGLESGSGILLGILQIVAFAEENEIAESQFHSVL